MTSVTALKSAIVMSMKAKNTENTKVLRSLMNKANMIAKTDGNRDVTDEDVVNAAIKTVKEVTETATILKENGRDTSEQDLELSIVETFMPQKMSDVDLERLIGGLIKDENCPEGKAARGFVMKNLNADFRGQFDNAKANEIIGRVL